ncbi:hypothetical protein [Bradyrhizobium sp. 31Argb]|uniref:hypothetical protein n=1 Tax=Bradyrhizobium sp. 31Argb TaxID=3141247 RepID=UPI003747B11E
MRSWQNYAFFEAVSDIAPAYQPRTEVIQKPEQMLLAHPNNYIQPSTRLEV